MSKGGAKDNNSRDPSLVQKLHGLKDVVNDVAYHPTQQQVAAACKDGSVLTWDLPLKNSHDDKPGCLRAYKFCGHSGAVTSVCFSSNGSLLASCSADKMVRVWENGVEGRSVEFKAHTSTIRYVDFAPVSADKIITASDDKSIKMWTVQGHKFLKSFTGHTNSVLCAKFSPTGDVVASVSSDSTVKLFDVNTGKEFHTFQEPKGHATHLDWHPGGSCVGVATADKKVKVYDIRMLKLQQLYGTHTSVVSQVSFHPCGNYLASSSHDGSLKIYDLLEARPIYDLLGHRGPVTCVQFSGNGEYFASGEEDKLVLVWKTNIEKQDEQLGSKNHAALAEAKAPNQNAAPIKERQPSKPLNSDSGMDSDKENATSEKKETGREQMVRGKSVDIASLYALVEQSNAKFDVLKETVITMEKRLSLLEDQLRLNMSAERLSDK